MTTPSPKRTWWRIALVALGAVILLLGGVYVALVRAFPPARLAALLAEQVQTATGREFRIGGALSLQLLPTIAVVARDVSLGNARWGTRPEMATVKRAAFELAVAPLLHGELHVLSIDVDGADVLLETNEQGHPNWVFAESAQRKPSSDVVGQPPAVRLDQLSLSDAHIAFRVGLTKVAHAIDIESLQVVNDGERNGVAARFAGRHRAWRLDATMGRYEALVLGQSDWPFDVQLSSDGAKLAATGSLDTRGTLRAKVSAQIDNAAALAPLLGDTTALPLPIVASAQVQRSASAVTADALRVTVAGQSVSGKVTVHTRPAGPSVEMDLAAATIDLSRWGMKPPSAAPTQGTVATKEPLFGDAPLPAIAWPETPLRARLQIDELIAPGLPALAAVRAQIQLERDRLRAESLSFGLAGGTVRGRFELSGGAPLRVAWRGEADALSIDALAALRGASGYVRGGRVNMRASLDASGRTPRQLAASLDGSALLWANDTALTGSATVMEHNIVVALLQALLPRQEAAQALKIDCAVVNLALHDGVARIDRTIAMETDRVAVAASGELNLAAQTVTLNFQPVVKKGLGLDSSANLAKLVMLEGPLHDPRIGIDVKGTAREAASLGAAVATAGLTLVGKRLLSGPEDTQVCKRAMGPAAR